MPWARIFATIIISPENVSGHFHINVSLLTTSPISGEQGEYCDYQHGERVGGGELLVVKHKARNILCPLQYCRDFECYFGHHCKYGKQCTIRECESPHWIMRLVSCHDCKLTLTDRCLPDLGWLGDTHDMDLVSGLLPGTSGTPADRIIDASQENI